MDSKDAKSSSCILLRKIKIRGGAQRQATARLVLIPPTVCKKILQLKQNVMHELGRPRITKWK